MITDALVNFVPPGSPLSLIGAANSQFASLVFDMIGAGVGQPPQNIIGTRTLFGQDSGIGSAKPLVESVIGTTIVGAGASVNCQFQAAVDTGASGGYLPGTWITLVETGAIAIANLTAQAIFGRFDFPPAFPAGTLPRYLRLNYVVTGAAITAGSVAFAIVTNARDDWAAAYAAKNYAVA